MESITQWPPRTWGFPGRAAPRTRLSVGYLHLTAQPPTHPAPLISQNTEFTFFLILRLRALAADGWGSGRDAVAPMVLLRDQRARD